MLADVIRRATGGLPNIGDPFMGGYFAGIIDTTKGNIIAADASQAGKRYALIVAPKALESSGIYWDANRSTTTPAPAGTHTRWDGLSATAALVAVGTRYAPAVYCNGLSHDVDGGSAWYLPAMDELELIYRNLKSTTELNAVGTVAASTFPGSAQPYGYNPSSDPSAPAYTATVPSRTTVAAFQDGGGQDLGDVNVAAAYFTSTEYNTSRIWSLYFSGANAGLQATPTKDSYGLFTRPVRRLIL